MIKNNKGFTIVEITITVFIIAILAGITIVAFTKVQTDARDSERASKTKIIAEALEKYYERNGEYPGCAAMTQAGNLVSSNVLKGIDTDVLLTPKSTPSSTNSFTCTSLTAGAGDDVYAYVGNSNATCSTGAACLYYTLQYRQEGTGNIISLDSRRKITGVVPTAPVLSAAPVAGINTSIKLTWPAVPNAASYVVQRASDSNFTLNIGEATLPSSFVEHTSTSLTPGTTYYYRLAAEGAGGRGPWSNTASATTTISPPAVAPTITLTSSPAPSGGKTTATSVVATANSVTCVSGSVEYQMRSSSMYAGVVALPAWSATWSTSQALPTTNMSQGYRYDFQARARCVGPNANSSPSADGTVATVTRKINTPPAPVYLSPPYFYSNVNAIVNYSYTCPTNTSLYNGYFNSKAWTGSSWGPNYFPFNDSWENYDGVNRNVEYWGYYQCSTPYDTSLQSPAYYNVIVVRP